MSGFAEALLGAPGAATTEAPMPSGMDAVLQAEQAMAQQVQQQAPDVAQEIMAALSEDGITQEEVDEFRSLVVGAMQSPDAYPALVDYMVQTEMLEPGEPPPEYSQEYLMILLGVVGMAQSQVGAAPMM